MLIPFPIQPTIEARRSARSYEMRPVEPAVLEAVKDFAGALPVPFDHRVEIRFFHAEPTKTLYLVMKSPPDNLAFMAETDCVSISQAGFVGELLILYAESQGLATCWYNPQRKPRPDAGHIDHEIHTIEDMPKIALM